MRSRDTSIDGIKFILIVLVVLGHVILPWMYTQWGVGYLFSLIYFFHMPLFIMIAGYFSKETNWHKLAKGSARQMESFLWMCLALTLILHDKFFNVVAYKNWFIFSLVCWKVMNFLLARLTGRGWQLLALSFALYVISFFVVGNHNRFMYIEKTIQFYPCFVVGYLLSADQLAALRQSGKISRLCYVMIPLLLAVIAVFSGMNLHYLETHWATATTLPQDFSPGIWLLLDLLTTAGGILACFIILALAKFKGRWTRYGRYTLFIYMVQGAFTTYTQNYCSYHFYMVPLLVVAVVAFCIAVCRYIPYKWLTAPICSLAENVYARNIDRQ